MKKYEIKCSRNSNTSWKRNYFANLQIKSWNAFYCIYFKLAAFHFRKKMFFARWRKIWITWYSWMMRSPLSTNNEPVSTVNFQTLYVLQNVNITMQIEWNFFCWNMKHLICEARIGKNMLNIYCRHTFDKFNILLSKDTFKVINFRSRFLLQS